MPSAKRGQRRPAGMSFDFLARQIRSSQRRSRVPGNRLHINVVERAARFQRPHQKHIQENSAGQAQRARSGLLLQIFRELQHQLLEIILRASRQIRAHHRIRRGAPRRKAQLAIKLRRENSAMVRPGFEIAAVQHRKAVGFPVKQFAEHRQIFRQAILAEPLDFVFFLVRAQPGKLGHARIKPAKRIGKLQRVQRANLVSFALKYPARQRIRAFIQRKNQRMVKAGGVIRAGRVAEMMIEMNRPRTATQQMQQLFLQSRARRPPFPLASAGRFGRRIGAFRQRNGAAIGKFYMILVEAALQSQPRNVRRILPAQFFFFNGEQDGVIVDQRHRRTSSQCGDAEYVHERA